MKKFSIIFVLVFLTFSQIHSQPQIKDSLLYEKVNQLQKNEDNIKLLYEAKSEQLKTDYGKFKNDLEDQTNFYKVLGWIFGSVTIVGLVIGCFSVYYKAKDYADKKVKETIDNLIEIEKGKIISIVKSYDEEYQLKINSTILVVSSKAHEKEFEVFFDKLGFSNVQYVIDEDKPANLREHDMIFFNNEDGYFDDEKIQRYYSTDSNQVYFILGTKRVEILKSMNCSNSRISMYNNLMSTLKYQSILIKATDKKS